MPLSRSHVAPVVLVGALLAASAFVRQPQSATSSRAADAARVKAEFLHAWNGYKQYAWGHDELQPVSRTARDWYDGATLLMTPVDALDTMTLMGLDDEATRTREYVAEHLQFDRDISVSVFEITIRLLGGLVANYQLSGDARLLAKADDLAARLLPAFDSPTGMPYRFVNLRTGATSGPISNPAEIGTLVLEFGTLSDLVGKPVYFAKARKALAAVFDRRSPETGLVGEGIDVTTGTWTNPSSHIGGAIDSYYEYLLKCERLFGDDGCGAMWQTSVEAVNRYVADDTPDGLWYGVVDMRTGRRTAKTFGSLDAFFPAVLAMSGDLDRARRLQASSMRMWTLNHVEPEALDYAGMKVTDAGYALRPEIVESAYYLEHYTHDPRYLDEARQMFDDLQRCCRTDAGYTVLTNVATKAQGDRQHSFLLAETFKYFYLLFDPGALSFDSVVFNTEAHPLKRVRSVSRDAAGQAPRAFTTPSEVAPAPERAPARVSPSVR